MKRAPNKPLPPMQSLADIFATSPATGALIRRCTGRACGNKRRTGYLIVRIARTEFQVHRILWALYNGRDPGALHIDHINGDKADNRPENLRAVSPSENAKNRALARSNKSGVSGVCWSERHKRWRVKVGRREIAQCRDFETAIAIRREGAAAAGINIRGEAI